MNQSEIERLVDIISSDEIEVRERLSEGQSITLVLRNPTKQEKAKSARIYAQAFREARSSGMPDEKEAIDHFIKLGRWSEKQEQEIAGIRDDIRKIKRGLLDLLFVVSKLEKARTLLRRAESVLIQRIIKRQELLEHTAENHALTASQRFLIGRITTLETGDRFWASDDIFENYDNIRLINNLCNVFFRTSHINIQTIRYIARSNYWRSIWVASQKTGDLFGKPMAQLTDNQRELVSWSCVYDNVYESYDRPQSLVVEDDDLLDSWFIRQGEKIEERSKKSSSDDHISTSKRKGGRQECFIVADQEGAERVYAMNDPTTRQSIKSKQKLIDQHKSIKEQHMPDSQQEMREIAVGQLRKHVLKK